MNANRFGQLFSVTTFGESHGSALGCVIDGCPAGVTWDASRLQVWMDRRRPGAHAATSQRNEPDTVEVLSGVFEGRTLGSPIAMITRNQDARSSDYSREKIAERPGHAADLWDEKFGHSDYRGSGRASGRETVARVMGGAVAEMFVRHVLTEATVSGVIAQLGPWRPESAILPTEVVEGLSRARTEGESYGGVVRLTMSGLPAGLGQPVFHKLKSDLAMAMMSVGATAGVDFGDGFLSTDKRGSEFHSEDQIYGGLRGGISTGGAITMRVAFKPASTLGKMAREGRHDPAIVPRALPVLEAMAWLVVADHVLWRRLDQITPSSF